MFAARSNKKRKQKKSQNIPVTKLYAHRPCCLSIWHPSPIEPKLNSVIRGHDVLFWCIEITRQSLGAKRDNELTEQPEVGSASQRNGLISYAQISFCKNPAACHGLWALLKLDHVFFWWNTIKPILCGVVHHTSLKCLTHLWGMKNRKTAFRCQNFKWNAASWSVKSVSLQLESGNSVLYAFP